MQPSVGPPAGLILPSKTPMKIWSHSAHPQQHSCRCCQGFSSPLPGPSPCSAAPGLPASPPALRPLLGTSLSSPAPLFSGGKAPPAPHRLSSECEDSKGMLWHRTGTHLKFICRPHCWPDSLLALPRGLRGTSLGHVFSGSPVAGPPSHPFSISSLP